MCICIYVYVCVSVCVCVWVCVCLCVCVSLFTGVFLINGLRVFTDLNGCRINSNRESGIYPINPTRSIADCNKWTDVYCNMNTDGEGWTVSCLKLTSSIFMLNRISDAIGKH